MIDQQNQKRPVKPEKQERIVMATAGAKGAKMTMTTATAEMERMSVEQLKAVKEQTDLEVNLLQDSLTNIRTATSRLDLASTALHDLSLRPQGNSFS